MAFSSGMLIIMLYGVTIGAYSVASLMNFSTSMMLISSEFHEENHSVVPVLSCLRNLCPLINLFFLLQNANNICTTYFKETD